MTTPMLSVDGLRAAYGPVQVLFDVDLEVAPGRVTTLVGANGAGKTTIMKTLAGLVSPRAMTWWTQASASSRRGASSFPA